MKKYLKYLLLKNKKLFIILIVLFIVVHPLFILNNILGQYLNLYNEVRAYTSIAFIYCYVFGFNCSYCNAKKANGD